MRPRIASPKLEAKPPHDLKIGLVEIVSIPKPCSEATLTVSEFLRVRMDFSRLNFAVLLQTFRPKIYDQTKDLAQVTQDAAVPDLSAFRILNTEDL